MEQAGLINIIACQALCIPHRRLLAFRFWWTTTAGCTARGRLGPTATPAGLGRRLSPSIRRGITNPTITQDASAEAWRRLGLGN